jgi:hypothetical protein
MSTSLVIRIARLYQHTILLKAHTTLRRNWDHRSQHPYLVRGLSLGAAPPVVGSGNDLTRGKPRSLKIQLKDKILQEAVRVAWKLESTTGTLRNLLVNQSFG